MLLTPTGTASRLHRHERSSMSYVRSEQFNAHLLQPQRRGRPRRVETA